MRTMLAKLLWPDPSWTCASATTGAGAILADAGEIALQLVGVGLPVVLAAFTGAFLARAYAPPANFWRALGASCLWTVAGCAAAPGFGLLASKFGIELSAVPLALAALVVALIGPMLLPIAMGRLRAFAQAKADKWGQP